MTQAKDQDLTKRGDSFEFPFVEDEDDTDQITRAIMDVHVKHFAYLGLPIIVSCTAYDPLDIKDDASIDGSVWEVITAKGHQVFYACDAGSLCGVDTGSSIIVTFLGANACWMPRIVKPGPD